MEQLDKYTHKLSVKEEIAYEHAREHMKNSIKRLKEKKYKSNNLFKSAYKYCRIKIPKLIGGTYNYKINY